ncbi:tetratricopeptide repeat protein, partial [candidate division CSSED10-310 bacterium]
ITRDEFSQQLFYLSQKTYFHCLLLTNADYSFQEVPDILTSIAAGQNLIETFQAYDYLTDSLLDLTNFYFKLSKVPVQSETGAVVVQQDAVAERILANIDGLKSTHQILYELSDIDIFDAFLRFYNLLNEGMIQFSSEKPMQFYASFPGTEEQMDAILEVYIGILPTFTALMQETGADQKYSADVLAHKKVQLFYPLLFQKVQTFQSALEFVENVRSCVLEIEPQYKLPFFKKGLSAYLLELLFLLKGIEGGAEYYKCEHKARTYLDYTQKMGYPSQSEISRDILLIINLVNDALREVTAVVSEVVDERSKLDQLVSEGNILEAYMLLREEYSERECELDETLVSQIHTDVLALFKQEVGDQTIKFKAISFQDPALIACETLDSDDGFILSQLQSPLSINQLLQITGIQERELYHRLYNLKHKNLIYLPSPPSSQKKSGPPPPAGQAEDLPVPRADTPPIPGALRKEDQKLLQRLRLELQEMSVLSPHEIFGLTPRSTKQDFEDNWTVLKSGYIPENYPASMREQLKPLLNKITVLIDEAAEMTTTYFRSRKTKPPAPQLPPQPVSEHAEVAAHKAESAPSPRSISDPHAKKTDQEVKKVTGPDTRVKKAQELFQKGIMLRKQNHYQEAIDCFQQAQKLTPQNYSLQSMSEQTREEFQQYQSKFNFEKGLQAQQNGDIKAALQHFKQAVKFDTKKPEYFFEMAKLLATGFNQVQKAEYHCRKALEMEPGKSAYHVLLGKLLKAQGMLTEARNVFLEALRWNKQDADARRELNLLP